jgi:hypothetical protein
MNAWIYTSTSFSGCGRGKTYLLLYNTSEVACAYVIKKNYRTQKWSNGFSKVASITLHFSGDRSTNTRGHAVYNGCTPYKEHRCCHTAIEDHPEYLWAYSSLTEQTAASVAYIQPAIRLSAESVCILYSLRIPNAEPLAFVAVLYPSKQVPDTCK